MKLVLEIETHRTIVIWPTQAYSVVCKGVEGIMRYTILGMARPQVIEG
jgi:hypothetical protein